MASRLREFCDVVWEGLGRIKLKDGSFCVGHFRNGFLNGWGVVSTTNPKELEEGNWQAHRLHGHGVRQNESATYEGEFRDGLEHGFGVARFSDGTSYRGNWIGGCGEGRGVTGLPDGHFYVGDHVLGKRQGIGYYAFSNGLTYAGTWKGDRMTGLGAWCFRDSDAESEDDFEPDEVFACRWIGPEAGDVTSSETHLLDRWEPVTAIGFCDEGGNQRFRLRDGSEWRGQTYVAAEDRANGIPTGSTFAPNGSATGCATLPDFVRSSRNALRTVSREHDGVAATNSGVARALRISLSRTD